MKKYLAGTLTVCLLLLTAASAPAQRIPRLSLKSLSRVSTHDLLRKITPRVLTPPFARLPQAISRAAQVPHATVRMTAVKPSAPIRAAVLPIAETFTYPELEAPFTATAFVIEEEYEGKKYLWGVTAAHIEQQIRAFPAVWKDEKNPLPIDFAALGNAGMTDLALFDMPDSWPDGIKPLKLADKLPAPGEKTYSFGFFNDDFYLVPNRKVKEVTPTRLITSLEFDTPNRGGACGGPILNKQGEVVGVHIGSSDSQRVSFVVPVTEIKRLLYAYRHGGKNLQTLTFNGINVGKLNINESIARIRAVTDGHITGEFIAYHHEKDLDYAHLERLFSHQQPDEVQIFVIHKAFSFTGDDRKDFFFQLTFHPSTQKTTRTLISRIPK